MGDVLMRLIDADKLYDEIAQYRDENMFGGGNLLVDDILEDINLSPTVDAEPVRHGKWILYPDNQSKVVEADDCSVCGAQWIFGEKYDYCPSCGAKMDGE